MVLHISSGEFQLITDCNIIRTRIDGGPIAVAHTIKISVSNGVQANRLKRILIMENTPSRIHSQLLRICIHQTTPICILNAGRNGVFPSAEQTHYIYSDQTNGFNITRMTSCDTLNCTRYRINWFSHAKLSQNVSIYERSHRLYTTVYNFWRILIWTGESTPENDSLSDISSHPPLVLIFLGLRNVSPIAIPIPILQWYYALFNKIHEMKIVGGKPNGNHLSIYPASSSWSKEYSFERTIWKIFNGRVLMRITCYFWHKSIHFFDFYMNFP